MRKRPTHVALGLVLACVSVAPRYFSRAMTASSELYPSQGIRPDGVRQGTLGSCYFHSVVAAFAQARPEVLEKMIRANSDGTFTVEFADGKKENAYPEDIDYARSSGYDRSDGLWVAVLFRAYAQKVLRQLLLDAVDKSEMFPLVKKYAEEFIEANDPLLLAYDRAIRSQVDQAGNIDKTKLEGKLKLELSSISVSEDIKDSFIKMLESGGFFDSLSQTIKENGELFGAYRAVGQGGIAERVMQTFGGSVVPVPNEEEARTAAALTNAVQTRRPIVACSGGSQYYQQLAAGQDVPPGVKAWYVNSHCYTVLGYDADSQVVTLRNPWGEHPDPDGILRLPLRDFMPAFRGIATVGP